ncbi:hypothetical protein KY284_033137 [Solanum tuberosum]|nr:hypothetical protein KY284_033137 [Solanum tuberosum]
MERVVNPGPIDRTLLLSQHEHESELSWKGEISFSSLMKTVRMNDAWYYFVCIDLMDVLRRSYVGHDYITGCVETLTECAIASADMDGVSPVRIHSIIGYLRDQLQVNLIGYATPVERVWCWERILPVQPSTPPPHDGDVLLPYARRWTRGIDRNTESHHVLIPIRDRLDRMTKDQFRWTPYNEILHTLPRCCTVDEPLWMACVPMLCLEIVEVHAPDRVMHQFGRPQHVHAIPSWGTNHHVHDQRRRLGSKVFEMLDNYFRDWDNRHQSLAVEVDDDTSGAGYKLCYMRYGRLLIGKPALKIDVPSGFVHSASASIAMSRGLFKLHSLALQWQKYTTLLHMVKRGPRRGRGRGRGGHKSRARGRALGRGINGIPIPPDIEAEAGVEADDLHIHQFGTSDIMNLLDMSFGDYIPDMAGTAGTAHCDTEDTALYNTQDFIEGLLDDPIESQIHTTGPSSTLEESPTTIIEDFVPTVNEDPDVTQIHTTGPSSTVEESPTTIIEDVVPTIHATVPSSTVEESPMTIIEDVVPTVNEDSVVTQIHTTGPSSTMDVRTRAYTLDVAGTRRPLLVPKRTLILADYKRKTDSSIQSLKTEIKVHKT